MKPGGTRQNAEGRLVSSKEPKPIARRPQPIPVSPYSEEWKIKGSVAQVPGPIGQELEEDKTTLACMSAVGAMHSYGAADLLFEGSTFWTNFRAILDEDSDTATKANALTLPHSQEE